MISKELLNEVLEEEVLSVRPYISDDPFYKNVIMWECRKNTYDTINIYELAHKCKEWLLDNGYYIKISPFKVELFEKDTNCFMRDFYSPVQSKSIPYYIKREIQACQWILDNKAN